jgi:hypothetical protein
MAKALGIGCTTFATLQLQPEVHHDILWMGRVTRLVALAGCVLSTAPWMTQSCLDAWASVFASALVVLMDALTQRMISVHLALAKVT